MKISLGNERQPRIGSVCYLKRNISHKKEGERDKGKEGKKM